MSDHRPCHACGAEVIAHRGLAATEVRCLVCDPKFGLPSVPPTDDSGDPADAVEWVDVVGRPPSADTSV